MNAKNNKYRGAVFIQQALILAFVIVVGVVFLNDKSLSGSVGTVFDNGVELLASALGNEHSNGGDSQQGGNSGNGSNGGTTNEGSSTEPSKPLPEDNPDFGGITVHGVFGYNSLGGLGSDIIYPLFNEYREQIPYRNQYTQYQVVDFDYISWENNKVTIGFKTIDGYSRDPIDITVHENSQFMSNLVKYGISTDNGTMVISEGGQLIQRNNDKSVYTSLDILKHDGTEYIHYGY